MMTTGAAGTTADRWCKCSHAKYNHGEDDFSPQDCKVNGCDCDNFNERQPPPETGGEWSVFRFNPSKVLNSPDGTSGTVVAEAQSRELAAWIVADHNTVPQLREALENLITLWARTQKAVSISGRREYDWAIIVARDLLQELSVQE